MRAVVLLNVMLFCSLNLMAQSGSQVVLKGNFALSVINNTELTLATDLEKSIESSFQISINKNKDTVLLFIGDELYTQALLEMKQDIFSMKSINEFNTESKDILKLQGIRDLRIKKKGSQLFIADFGPKKSEMKGVPLEIFCFDFVSRKTMIINSSNSLTEWNVNLQTIRKRTARKIFKSLY